MYVLFSVRDCFVDRLYINYHPSWAVVVAQLLPVPNPIICKILESNYLLLTVETTK